VDSAHYLSLPVPVLRPGDCRDRYREGLDRLKATVMKSKAAVKVEPGGPLMIEEIDIPDPGPNQVMVRNFASGVCYSQVH
jgi:hypothetical protein